MKQNDLATTALQAPHQLKTSFPMAPRLVFLATLSLYVANAPAATHPAVELPVVGDLDIEFRCSGVEGPCPMGEGGEGSGDLFFGNLNKYLQFEALEAGVEVCAYTPLLTEGTDGIGVDCDGGGDSRINSNEVLKIDVLDGGEGGEGSIPSSSAMSGIYVEGLDNEGGEGFGCFTGTQGTVFVERDGGPTMELPWTSDNTDEGGEGFCSQGSPHAIFVDFGGVQQVTSIRVEVDESGGHGVYAAGIELADVSPDNCAGDGLNNNDCVIELVEDPLPGGDLRAIIADPSLVGNVGPVEGFPVRVRDDRSHCQPDAEDDDPLDPDDGGKLVFNESNEFFIDGALVSEPLPLVVSSESGEYFSISAKGCGVPRLTFNGAPVLRDTPLSAPYIDIIAIETDIVPVASILEFESDGLNTSAYACQDALTSGDATLEQPFFEINARDDEIKYLAGPGAGIIDPVGRDIMVGCGSKRSIGRAFSFVAWNLIHAQQTDMRSELDAEIQVLTDTVARTANCVDPNFYRVQLRRWPGLINRYFDHAAGLATGGNEAQARFYFEKTAAMVDLFNARLQAPGVRAGFERCYASGPDLELIIDSLVTVPGPGDLPLNAYGDIIAQLEHLYYALKNFLDLLEED